jgi:uncharacterized membrane protein YhaH (DUF805 family)
MMIAMVPIMTSMFDRMVPAMQGDPHRFDNNPQAMFQLMTPMMQSMMTVSVVLAVLFAALTAAAIVRRLHDSDRSGWWVAPYYAIQIVSPMVSMSLMPRYFSVMSAASGRPGEPPDLSNPVFQQASQSMALMSLVGMLGFAVMVMMIVFLVLPGTVGPNRFGDDPLKPPFH